MNFVRCSNKCVVYQKANDVVFFITGSGEYTELICMLLILCFMSSE